MGEDRPVLGRVRRVLEPPAEQAEELDVGRFEPVAELGEPLDVVDVPGDRVPLPPPAFEEPAERHRLPPVDVERGLHRFDAQVADADQRRDAPQLGRDVVGHPPIHAEDVVVPGVERLDVVAHVDDVEVPADGEHVGQSAARNRTQTNSAGAATT